jgi:hypothetical protein
MVLESNPGLHLLDGALYMRPLFDSRTPQLAKDAPVRAGEVLPVRMRRGDVCVFNRAT